MRIVCYMVLRTRMYRAETFYAYTGLSYMHMELFNIEWHQWSGVHAPQRLSYTHIHITDPYSYGIRIYTQTYFGGMKVIIRNQARKLLDNSS